jgi:hypothetical protein
MGQQAIEMEGGFRVTQIICGCKRALNLHQGRAALLPPLPAMTDHCNCSGAPDALAYLASRD